METQGEFFAGKLMDLANLVAAALFFGPFLGGTLEWFPMLVGFSFYLVILVISLFLTKGKGNQ